jgi:hypothetical protein
MLQIYAKYPMSKWIWCSVLLSQIFFAASCNVSGSSTNKERTRKQVRLEWPLASIKETGTGVFYGKTEGGLFINAASGVALSKLVDLSMFGDFRPGITIEQAATRFWIADPYMVTTR